MKAAVDIAQRIARRANYMATRMIWEANHRDDAEAGDPKIGGHPAACASSVHIQTAFHLLVREPQDWVAMKPHASPVDHSVQWLLGLYRDPSSGAWLDRDTAKQALWKLRKFPTQPGEAVFQSYHAESDPDSWSCFPAGSVGIPPVIAGYSALAWRYAADHGFDVPAGAHFWALMGDSEFREGSLFEAMPDLAEREVGNLTWIVDFNRQSLDGNRHTKRDAARLEETARANGWAVEQVRHGRKRDAIFETDGGAALKHALENQFSDSEFQSLLFHRSGERIRRRLGKLKPVKAIEDDDALFEVFADLGGHDVGVLADAMLRSKENHKQPTLLIVHTIKGWGLQMAAAPGNHSALPKQNEVDAMQAAEGITGEDPFGDFEPGTPERAFLDKRGTQLRNGIDPLKKGTSLFSDLPQTIGVNLKVLPQVHTQYVWGQLVAKLVRLGSDTPGDNLSADDEKWRAAARHILTLSPDVGTSTNVTAVMDGKVYGPAPDDDHEPAQRGRPALTPQADGATRHLRFEIAEASAMCAAGAFGKMSHMTGVPLLPFMTVYDFFIKRCLDQLYYNLYWGSSFIVVGTPSGITLSPEGAQHSWKSDIQMPNLVTWEPAFGIEVDWILADAVRRHFERDNAGRSGVILRCVTRALEQKLMTDRMCYATVEEVRRDCLRGGWYLVDRRNDDGYLPGENVLNIFVMGALVPEALEASDRLGQEGVFANIIVVSSADLLCGNLGHADNYTHLRDTLGVNGDLHVARSTQDRAGAVVAAGARVPIVSVHDGEPGLLDNLGAIVGVQQETLAVRHASKCGRPSDVYRYQKMDAASIYQAAWTVLERTAAEDLVVERGALAEIAREASRP